MQNDNLQELGFDESLLRSQSSVVDFGAGDDGTVTSDSSNLDNILEVESELILGKFANIRGGQETYNTGRGFFLGYHVDNYKFSIGDPDSDYLKWDGSTLSFTGGKYIEVTASDNLKASADTEGSLGTGSSTSYSKVKEFKVGLDGVMRMKFDIHTSDYTLGDAYGQIYVNGSAVGTERTQGSPQGNNDYVTFSEDITVAAGDLVQLYTKAGNVVGSVTIYWRNFRLYYDKNYYGDYTVNLDT